MTGMYIRILRAGHWQNIEFDQLTDEELDKMAQDYPDRGWFWAKGLAKWIRDYVLEPV